MTLTVGTDRRQRLHLAVQRTGLEWTALCTPEVLALSVLSDVHPQLPGELVCKVCTAVRRAQRDEGRGNCGD